MQTGLYVALSGQMALQQRLDTIADNVANMSTVGFRATGVKFADVVSGSGQNSVDFASTGVNYLSDAQGPLEQTNDPFDFAVKGKGWFGIQTPAGTVMTRDGRFTMNANGLLVTHEGYSVLDAGGAPIQLNPTGGAPHAGQDGALYQGGKLVAAIGLFTFDPGPNVQRFGNSGVIPGSTPQPVIDQNNVGIEQGYVEQSNVNPIKEMTKLIEVQRAFDDAAALSSQTGSSLDDAIKTLGSSTS